MKEKSVLGAPLLFSVPGFPAIPTQTAPRTHAQVEKAPLKESKMLDLGPKRLEFGGREIVPSAQVYLYQATVQVVKIVNNYFKRPFYYSDSSFLYKSLMTPIA